jgi:hypothetical protein
MESATKSSRLFRMSSVKELGFFWSLILRTVRAFAGGHFCPITLVPLHVCCAEDRWNNARCVDLRVRCCKNALEPCTMPICCGVLAVEYYLCLFARRCYGLPEHLWRTLASPHCASKYRSPVHPRANSQRLVRRVVRCELNYFKRKRRRCRGRIYVRMRPGMGADSKGSH